MESKRIFTSDTVANDFAQICFDFGEEIFCCRIWEAGIALFVSLVRVSGSRCASWIVVDRNFVCEEIFLLRGRGHTSELAIRSPVSG
jgi:hypothetical protein